MSDSAAADVGDESPGALPDGAAEAIWGAARHWYDAGLQPGIQVCLRYRGEVVLNRAIGQSMTVDTPVCVFSTAKAITATVVHLLYERGALRPGDRVADLIPGYERHGKGRTTVDHVLTHRAGVPVPTGPRPDLRRSEDSEYTRAMLAQLRPVYPPGTLHMYHALTWGPLMREIVLAATGRSIREILATEILDPLGFRWTNFGVSADDVPLVMPSRATGPPTSGAMDAAFRRVVGGTLAQTIAMANKPGFLTGVVPSSNTVSTAFELSRFAELLRRGGELDGVRVLHRNTLYLARRERRRLRPDLATGGTPLRWASGYMLGSDRHGPFGRGAPAAFGHTGLTQIAMWADPQRHLAAAVVSTGKPSPHPEEVRYPALLDAITAHVPSGG